MRHWNGVMPHGPQIAATELPTVREVERPRVDECVEIRWEPKLRYSGQVARGESRRQYWGSPHIALRGIGVSSTCWV